MTLTKEVQHSKFHDMKPQIAEIQSLNKQINGMAEKRKQIWQELEAKYSQAELKRVYDILEYRA